MIHLTEVLLSPQSQYIVAVHPASNVSRVFNFIVSSESSSYCN